MITPLVREALARNLAPRDVDGALVEAICAAARARGVARVESMARYVRLGWNRLGEACPELGLRALRRPGRSTPRRDQWGALPEAFRVDLEDFLRSLGFRPTGVVTQRNLLLRAKDAVDRASVGLSCFGDLFAEDARGAVVGDARWFGRMDAPNQTRSRYFELGRRYARLTRDEALERDFDDLLTGSLRLPVRSSSLGKASLQRIDELQAPGRLEDLVAETEKRIRAYAASGGDDARARAQTALLTRIGLALPCSRQMLMSASFLGPLGAGDGAPRPVLTLQRHGQQIEIESRLSPVTVGLISGYHARASDEVGAPRTLYEHAPGRPKSAESLSENIRRLGRDVDLPLSPQTLKDFAVALLIRHAKAHPDRIDLLDVKDLMDIDQFINFKSRYGVLCSDELFEAVASLSGLR